MGRIRSGLARLAVTAALIGSTGAAVTTTDATAGATSTTATGIAATGITQAGRWTTDAAGRVVILHGLNQVMKTPPYEPSQDGFSDDDAAFLAANGFDAMRVGVIWAAVEPKPGVYNDHYLAALAATVHMLARHGIVSLLDFHQDLYNEVFQGEGAPAWAVQTGGEPNPALGFPGNYLANPAQWHAWDAFWSNATGPDGVGLQTHYAHMWAHVAKFFAADKAVAGYEVLNEPWPGSLGEQCATPLVGCPTFDSGALSAFYRRVDTAIRAVDRRHTIDFEPNVLFTQSDATSVQLPKDTRATFAYHDYCSTEEVTANNALCPPQDDKTVETANSYADTRHVPNLLTEFGATNDLPNISDMVARADRYRVGWFEWAYTGHDKTSASPDGQALVLDPAQPPTGANVLTDKLKTLAEPYPIVVSGRPSEWKFTGGVFRFVYSTLRADGRGRFAAGTHTVVAVPRIHFPHGYRVTVTGAKVVSAANSYHLVLADTARAVRVTVTPR